MKCCECGKEIQSNDKKSLCKECKMKEKKRRLHEKIASANAPGGEREVKFGIDPFFG